MLQKLPAVYYTNPDIIQYLVNKDDALKYSRGSNQHVQYKCKKCGFVRNRPMSAIVNNPESCLRCSDGISYPNKFVLNFLLQLGLDVEPEKSFDWSMKKKYDDYIKEYNLIIENHGEQHYKEINSKFFHSLKNQMEIDSLKKNTALNNGIQYYVELDCRHSELEWIKYSIMESNLPKLLNFYENDIDWEECDKQSRKSLLVESCNLWEYEHLRAIEIAKQLHVCRPTIITYLKRGTKLGLCTYTREEEIRRFVITNKFKEFEDKKCKPIAIYNTFGITHIFKGASYLSNSSEELFGVFLSRPMISNVCNGKSDGCKGIKMKIITMEEYEYYHKMFNGEINPKNSHIYPSKQNYTKQVIAYLDGEFIDVFISCEEAAMILSEVYHKPFTSYGVKSTCLGQQKQHNGFTFQHITKEQYEQYKMILEQENVVVKEMI